MYKSVFKVLAPGYVNPICVPFELLPIPSNDRPLSTVNSIAVCKWDTFMNRDG